MKNSIAMDSKILASITALRAFEAASNHLSFTKAAAELQQTQGAISHQIRELEKRLGVKLFHREPLGIKLTESGKTYLRYVRESLDNLRAGEQALRPPVKNNTLTVSCSPNFAQKWLVPKLGEFLENNPTLEIRISASAQHIIFEDSDIDVAVRHGDGNWPNLSVTRLCEEWVFPVCSPHLVAAKSVKTVSDLSNANLIHDQQREGWSSWLQTVGADPCDFNIDHGLVLSQTSFAIDAAVAVQGVALARSALVGLDLSAGRLVRPVKEKVRADFAYWMVCPKQYESLPHIVSLREWMLDQTH